MIINWILYDAEQYWSSNKLEIEERNPLKPHFYDVIWRIFNVNNIENVDNFK